MYVCMHVCMYACMSVCAYVPTASVFLGRAAMCFLAFATAQCVAFYNAHLVFYGGYPQRTTFPSSLPSGPCAFFLHASTQLPCSSHSFAFPSLPPSFSLSSPFPCLSVPCPSLILTLVPRFQRGMMHTSVLADHTRKSSTSASASTSVAPASNACIASAKHVFTPKTQQATHPSQHTCVQGRTCGEWSYRVPSHLANLPTRTRTHTVVWRYLQLVFAGFFNGNVLPLVSFCLLVGEDIHVLARVRISSAVGLHACAPALPVAASCFLPFRLWSSHAPLLSLVFLLPLACVLARVRACFVALVLLSLSAHPPLSHLHHPHRRSTHVTRGLSLLCLVSP